MRFFGSAAFMGSGILRLVEVDGHGIPRELALHDFEIDPLTYEELNAARANQPITLSLAIRGAKMHPSSVNINLDPGRYTSSITIESKLTCAAYGLIEGGWMVPGIYSHKKCTYLLDRCAFKDVIALARKRNESLQQCDFLGWLADPGAKINFIPVVLEGNSRKRPTAFDLPLHAYEVEEKLKKALPLAELRPNAEHAALAASNLLDDPAFSIDNDRKFLSDVRHFLLNAIPHNRRQTVISEVCQIADSHNVRRLSFTCLAVISAILSNPRDNPARKLLKVNELNTDGGLHNALSDLRSLKILAMMISFLPHERLMFCTSDKNLAKFWVALNPRNMRMKNGRATWDISYGEEWFPGIDKTLFR
ncbi:hypothetical protein [Cereibacter sphaeroides]|uniref:hypothetical protein n=1 Tax=Cereibacter sphaeroides TaxID=1063 RepID=UPI003FCD5E6A